MTKELAERDMYGHPIIPIGDSGYGVSVSFFSRPSIGDKQDDAQEFPDFTIFHDSDGFQQSLFSMAVYKEGQVIHNTFEDRVAEALENK